MQFQRTSLTIIYDGQTTSTEIGILKAVNCGLCDIVNFHSCINCSILQGCVMVIYQYLQWGRITLSLTRNLFGRFGSDGYSRGVPHIAVWFLDFWRLLI